jgi:oxygen-dependent protoporphyrinogen oxidase
MPEISALLAPVVTRVPVLVVGAGLSGLVCAYALRKAGIDALIVEASARPGGVIRSERRDGYLLEYGPQSFNATSVVLDLCRELRIDSQLVQAPPHTPRFVFVAGELRAVPLSPPAFIKSPLFSLATKAKVLRDVFGHTVPPASDESIAAFVRRKFSPELLEKLMGPFVSGIYAGDPEQLSTRSAFPQLYEAEKSAGSVVRGLLRSGKKRGEHRAAIPVEKPTLRTFRDGNQTLIDALAISLGSSLRCSVAATSIRQNSASPSAPVFEITLSADGQQQTILAGSVVVATPTLQAAALLHDLDQQFEATLQQIQYAPIAVVSLGYSKASVGRSLDGFGFLVPRSSNLRILGTVWNSSLFPDRSPEGHVLLTSFVGGATDPQAIQLSKQKLAAMVHNELTPILGISQGPSFSSVWTYPRAIPQYNIGHAEHMSHLEQLHSMHPNVYIAGNYLRGPAIGACIKHALAVARQVVNK